MTHKDKNYFVYLPISEANMRFDLYMTGTGYTDIPAGSSYPPSGHPELYAFNWKLGRTLPEYQIIYISQGSGTFESAHTGTVKVGAGNAILLFPGIWHRYRPHVETGWVEHWISLNGEYLYRLTQRGLIEPSGAVLEIDSPGPILNTFTRITKKVQKNHTENAYVLSAYALEVLALVLDASPPMAKDQDHLDHSVDYTVEDTLVARAIEFIWNHSHRSMSISDIVESLHVNRRTLERRFEASQGYTLNQEITRCRIARVKHLLCHTNLPIEHVALATGFASAQRLCKVFKRKEEITPGSYRDKHRA